MYKTFLIKYAEIAIKGKNRYIFEDALVKNIKYQLRNLVSWVSVRLRCMRMRALKSSVKQLSSISTMYTRIRALHSR